MGAGAVRRAGSIEDRLALRIESLDCVQLIHWSTME